VPHRQHLSSSLCLDHFRYVPTGHVWTSVGKIWLLDDSLFSLGWVSCSQHCLSACSHDVCCICRPPTQPSPPSLLCDSSGPVARRGVHLFSHCACPPAVLSSIRLAVCFLISGDTSVSWDPVDLCFNTGFEKSPHTLVNPPG